MDGAQVALCHGSAIHAIIADGSVGTASLIKATAQRAASVSVTVGESTSHKLAVPAGVETAGLRVIAAGQAADDTVCSGERVEPPNGLQDAVRRPALWTPG